MWRVEIDLDVPTSVSQRTLVPVVTEEEKEARTIFLNFVQSLMVGAVVRLYAPNRLLIDFKRVEQVNFTQGEFHATR